jgi:hypothetical protein
MIHQDTLEFSAALVLGAAVGALAAFTFMGSGRFRGRSWGFFFRR